MKRVGIIDVGSNSMRLVIFEISKNRAFFPIEDIKETVRLGDGVNITGKMKESKIELGVKTMMLFNEICKRNQVDEIVAFGTAALRIAENGKVMVEKVREEVGIEIEVFSGEQEALTSFNGAINGLDIQDGVVIDLGGSSLEVVVFRNRMPVDKISLPFGAVTLGEIGDLKDDLSRSDEEKIRKYIGEKLDEVEWLKELKGLPLIGVGGTVRNIASIHTKMIDYPLDILHNYRMNLKDVRKVVHLVKDKKYKEKLEVEGLSKSRADLFVGAAIAVEELLNHCKMEGLIISGYGIREGVLYKKLNEYGKILTNVFEDSLNDILKHLGLDLDKKMGIYKNFEKIFGTLLSTYDIKNIDEKIIKVITHMENMGKIINFYNFNMNSFYMILNTGLKGIEHNQLLIAALIVARGGKKPELIKEYRAIISENILPDIMIASKILTLATIFNNVLGIGEEDFEIEITEKDIIFILKNNEKIDISIIDLYISEKRFVNSFDRELRFKIKK